MAFTREQLEQYFYSGAELGKIGQDDVLQLGNGDQHTLTPDEAALFREIANSDLDLAMFIDDPDEGL